MKKLTSIAILLAASFVSWNKLHAQAFPTATKTATIQAGAAFMSLKTDYAGRTSGVMFYADYDFLHFFHIDTGLEGEARLGGLSTPDGVGENSYLIGPRFSYRNRKLRIYGKVMAGRGTIFYNTADNNSSSSFYLLGAGGGVEYRIKPHFNIRAIDIEGQRWHGFPPNGLTPLAFSAGVAYIIR